MKLHRPLIPLITLCLFIACGTTSPTNDTSAGDTSNVDTAVQDSGAQDGATPLDTDVTACQASCNPKICAKDSCGAPCPACDLLPTPYGDNCVIQGSPDPPSAVSTVLAFPNLIFAHPIYATHAKDGSDRVFVVEKTGRIKVFPNQEQAQASDVTVFLDISDRVNAQPNEAGLLSVAFHPDYASNGRFFVNYTRTFNGQLQTVISSFLVSQGDPDLADPGSEQIILTIDQPYGNHNGGQIEFGHDGYLYIGMGDGGWAGDPLGAGQDTFQLLANVRSPALTREPVEAEAPGVS